MRTTFHLIATVFFSVYLLLPRFSYSQLRTIYTDTDSENGLVKASFYSANEGYLAFTKWIGYTQDSGRTIAKKTIGPLNVNYNGNSVNLTFGFAINGVVATEKNKLFVYGHYGFVPSILFSNDGGTTFNLVYHSLLSNSQSRSGITAMMVQNTGVCYAIDADRILKSINGGTAWTVLKTEMTAGFNQLQQLGDGHIIVTGFSKLYISQDHGGSWQLISSPSMVIKASWFINKNTGWVNTQMEFGEIYYTSDGGTNWRLMNSRHYGIQHLGSTKMKFINDSTGFAIGPEFTVVKSTDSGRVWEPLERTPYSYLFYTHNELYFHDDKQFWAGGGHGLLQLTSNGGGHTLPVAKFRIDAGGLASGVVHCFNLSKKGNEYYWYRNGALFSTDYDATYNIVQASIDTIMLVVAKGNAKDTSVLTIDTRVNPQPCEADFSFAVDTASINFTANYNSIEVKHYWYFGDGQADSVNVNPVHTYTKAGNYQVIHKVYNTIDHCADSSVQIVTITRTSRCSRGQIQYRVDSFYTSKIWFEFLPDANVEANPLAVTSLLWDFGDGTGAGGVTTFHEYQSEGTYIVSLRLQHTKTGCVSSIMTPVNIKLPSDCDADFLIDDTKEMLEFTGKPVQNKRHMWIFYNRDTIYTGDVNKLSRTFYKQVYGNLADLFNTATSRCNETWIKEYNLNELSGSVEHVVYDSINGCSSSSKKFFTIPTAKKVSVITEPDPNFPSYVSFSAFEKVNLVDNQGNSIDSVPYSSRWRINNLFQGGYDGGAAYTPRVAEYFPDTRVNIISIASSTCNQHDRMREVYTTYHVAPARGPCDGYPSDFSYSADSIDKRRVAFSASSTANYINTQLLGWRRKWIFGNDSSDLPDPVHTFPSAGIYPVTLKFYNEDGCIEEITKNVTTKDVVVCDMLASFEKIRNSEQAGNILFRNKTSPAYPDSKFRWDFGDGSLADTTINPVHLFTAPGTYNICMKVTRDAGCSLTYCDTVVVILSADNSAGNVVVYPNPVSEGNLVLSLNADVAGDFVINIMSAQGDVVQKKVFHAVAGNNILSIPVQGLNKGIYFIHITNGTQHLSTKFIKL